VASPIEHGGTDPASHGIAWAHAGGDRSILRTPSRVGEVPWGKMELSMAIAQRLLARFRVPADLLALPPKLTRRAPKQPDQWPT
jgi:hypothetical protein